MKNILLVLSTITVLQVSTCGNQSLDSYSKGDRSRSMVQDLYRQYLDANENIENLDDRYQDVLSQKAETLKDWNRYDRFSKRYWQEAKSHVSRYDTSLQKSLMTYFNQQEKKYLSSTKGFVNETDKIQQQTVEMQHNMSLMKLLASHKQLEVYLAKNKPDIKAIQAYNATLKTTTSSIDKVTQDLTKGNPIAKTLE